MVSIFCCYYTVYCVLDYIVPHKYVLLFCCCYNVVGMCLCCFQKLCVEIKAQLNNLTDLTAEGADFRWYIKVSNISTQSLLYNHLGINCTYPTSNCARVITGWLNSTIEEFERRTHKHTCILLYAVSQRCPLFSHSTDC